MLMQKAEHHKYLWNLDHLQSMSYTKYPKFNGPIFGLSSLLHTLNFFYVLPLPLI